MLSHLLSFIHAFKYPLLPEIRVTGVDSSLSQLTPWTSYQISSGPNEEETFTLVFRVTPIKGDRTHMPVFQTVWWSQRTQRERRQTQGGRKLHTERSQVHDSTYSLAVRKLHQPPCHPWLQSVSSYFFLHAVFLFFSFCPLHSFTLGHGMRPTLIRHKSHFLPACRHSIDTLGRLTFSQFLEIWEELSPCLRFRKTRWVGTVWFLHSLSLEAPGGRGKSQVLELEVNQSQQVIKTHHKLLCYTLIDYLLLNLIFFDDAILRKFTNGFKVWIVFIIVMNDLPLKSFPHCIQSCKILVQTPWQ